MCSHYLFSLYLFSLGFYIHYCTWEKHYLYSIILQLQAVSLRCLNKTSCTSTINHLLKSTQLVSLKLFVVIQPFSHSLIFKLAATYELP